MLSYVVASLAAYNKTCKPLIADDLRKSYVAIFEPDLQVYKSAVRQGKDFAKEKDFLVTFLKSQIDLLVIHFKIYKSKISKRANHSLFIYKQVTLVKNSLLYTIAK